MTEPQAVDGGAFPGDLGEAAARGAVRELVQALTPVPLEGRDVRSTTFHDLALDSVRLVELTMVLESVFQLGSYAMDDAPGLATLGDLEEYLAGLVVAGRATLPGPQEVAAAAHQLGEVTAASDPDLPASGDMDDQGSTARQGGRR
jgi:acyl carrier protein